MISFKRILFPVDFSERCRGAAAYVEAFAGRFQSELILLHVLEPPAEAYAPFEAGWADMRETQLQSYLREDMWPLAARRITVSGDPARKIVEIAREEEADLIMMPTHGYGPFRRFVLGSVTAKVLHDADCPVWTATHMDDTLKIDDIQTRNILCAVDVDDKAIHALRWAWALADEYGAPLTVAHAVPAIEARPDMYLDNEFRTHLMESARTRLSELMAEAGVEGRICVHAGEISKVIRDAAVAHAADLVVISRSSTGVLGRLRTHGYAIIRESPCPVLSV